MPLLPKRLPFLLRRTRPPSFPRAPASRLTTSPSPHQPPSPRPRPAMPDPEDCCGNDCRDCVFTTYSEALATWEAEAREEGCPQASAPL
jgi:hypothetical protein